MSVPVVNMSDAATVAAAEGQAALGVGDTALARQKYAEAGAIIEQEMKVRHGGSEKQFLRFLAATQYYKGGDYQKAQELAKKIDARVLPKNVRGLLPQFLKDVKLRASPGYAAGVRKVLLGLWQNRPAEALGVLQEHPYILPPLELAFFRATLCQRLGQYRAAALFYAKALHAAPPGLGMMFLTTATPLQLSSQGRLAEAWEYVQYQVELFPHPVTYTTASIVCYHHSVVASSENRKKWLEELLAFVEKAWDGYQKLSAIQRSHADMQAYMAFGFEIAAATWLRLGNKVHGKEVWDQAIKLGANPASSWATLAFATSQNGQASHLAEVEYMSERETHFSARFTHEPLIRQHLIGA